MNETHLTQDIIDNGPRRRPLKRVVLLLRRPNIRSWQAGQSWLAPAWPTVLAEWLRALMKKLLVTFTLKHQLLSISLPKSSTHSGEISRTCHAS